MTKGEEFMEELFPDEDIDDHFKHYKELWVERIDKALDESFEQGKRAGIQLAAKTMEILMSENFSQK